MALTFAAAAPARRRRTPEPATRDPNAATVIAEIALERGDCRTAAETYAAAAQRGDVAVARRASEVSLACEHLPAAWDSAKRWRALAPDDRDAAAVYATVALKLYRIPEARTAIATVIRPDEDDAKGSAKGRKPATKPIAKDEPKDADAKLAELTALLLEEADASAVLAALERRRRHGLGLTRGARAARLSWRSKRTT